MRREPLANKDIRFACMEQCVKFWQVALQLGISPETFTRRMRVEMTEDEKKEMCRIVGESGADYIKTSTGFSTAGATREDVKLMRENSPAHVKVKAAGGIGSLEDADDFIALGADRLGTSRVVKIIKQTDTGAGY